MTRHINLKDLRPQLSRVMDQVDKRWDRCVVTKRGQPIALIISADDYEGLLETIDILEDEAGLKRLVKAKKEAKQGLTRSLEEIRRSLARA